MEIKAYFGCGLTHAPAEFTKEVEDFKNHLRNQLGIILFDFVGLENGTAVDVYKHDIHRCVKHCDFMIGDFTFPSTGLGWEAGVVVEKHKKPFLGIAQQDAKVTRLVLGAECDMNPLFQFIRYQTLSEIIPHVEKIVSVYRKQLVLFN